MTEILVSVIMPTYNRGNTLRRAIDSVLRQTYANFELIIVDDGSTDSTLQVVQSYTDSRIRLICQMHGGANKARNTGIANAKGDYIAFQDSDDEWLSNKLAVQIKFMQERGYLVSFSPYYLYCNENVRVIPSDYCTNEKYHSNMTDILRRCNVIGTPTIVLRKDVLSLLNGRAFDETLPRFQEYELMLRIVQVLEIGYIEEPLVNAYQMGRNISINERSLYDAMAKILNRHKNFLDIKAFLNSYIVNDAEYKDIPTMLQEIVKIQNSIDIEQIDIVTEIITYLSCKLKLKNSILNKLCQSAIPSLNGRKFAIYGIGVVARNFYNKVRKQGIKPEGFIVSSLDMGEPREIDGILVYTADAYPEKDVRVIICTSLRYQSEILDNMIRYNYTDICIYDEKCAEL